ncbi:MAG TPA: hypothetical protein VLK22_02075 [Candidatus Udaeobacter sp.]|nr:hypothetical protein [Candidatus Udaeobacter sp.]
MSKKIKLLFALLSALVFTGAGCVQLNNTAGSLMGVFRSVDAGETWAPKSALLTAQGVKSLGGAKVYKIFTDPSDPKALYMGTRGQGLYYSYDNGETWNASAAMAGKYIYALAVDPRDKCTIYLSDGQHIFKTIDCQRTWNLIFTEERITQRFVALAVDSTDSKIIYGAELGGDIFRSRDSGVSWFTVNRFGFEIRDLAVDTLSQNRLYVAAYNQGLFRSENGGEAWVTSTQEFVNFSESLSFNRLVLNTTKKDSLFWISKYGILRSDDKGNSWKEIKLLTPPGSVNIYAFAYNPKNSDQMYYTATILGENNKNVRSTLYKTVDNGVTWITKNLPSNTIPVDLLVNRENEKTVFLGFTTLDQ